MQKFNGYWVYRLMLLFWICICTCTLIFFSITPMSHPDVTGKIFAGVMELTASSVGLFALCGLVVSFSRYELDERGVTRDGWNGTQQMNWSDVSRVVTNGQRNSTLTLIKSRNQKLVIERGLIYGLHLVELNALLEPRLAICRERQMREIGPNRVYFPKRNATWAGALLSLIIGLILLYVAIQPVSLGEGWEMALCLLLVGGVELLCVYLTIVAFTDTLTITSSGLVDKDLFRTREIAFADITSIIPTENGSLEVTEIRGKGTKISLPAKMNSYDLLVRYVREHVALTRSPANIANNNHTQQWRS